MNRASKRSVIIVTSRRAALAELACAWRSPSSGLIVSY
jgi:hypothetical protein